MASNQKGITNEQFIDLWNKLGSPSLVAKATGTNITNVHNRRAKLGLKTWNDTSSRRIVKVSHEGRINYNIENGSIIVFSDAHYWPDQRTTMHRALVSMIRKLKPKLIVNNGDAFDGGTISRWPRIGWDKKPSVIEELNAVKAALDEIESAAKEAKCSDLIWNLGNHDARYETKLAASAPEYEGVHGFHLKDHFPTWLPAWVTWVNDQVCITHYYHTGIHATHNNIVKGQCHYVTGHTHSLQIRPWTNAKAETLYGVDTGCLADALGSHNVDYQQGRHGNHRSGFAVLTFRNGQLLMPEICQKFDEDSFEFRGHILNADTGEII